MSAYTDFIDNVRAWANRDSDVLPDSVIQDALSYTADKAYKVLEIPVLEAIATYTIIEDTAIATSMYQVYIDSTSFGKSIVKLPIPSDLISFIHLRIKNSNNESKKGVVFNEKADIRTFFDMYSDRYTDFVWSRQSGDILASGDINVGDQLELYFYHRLPALDARYAITANNFNDLLIDVPTIEDTSGTTLYFANGTTYPPVPGTDTAYSVQNVAGDRVEIKFEDSNGQEVSNWLRDSNRQILLFGALSQCFDYLDDMPQSQKYKLKYEEAVKELISEEKKRKTSGGNIQMHFSSQLI